MEDGNKRKKTRVLVVAVLALFVLVLGATYAYFEATTISNFGTTNIYADTGGIGTVVIEGVDAQLRLNLTANELSENMAGSSFFATEDGTPVTHNHEETLGVISVTPSTDTNRYKCTYKVNVTHSGTNDMYNKFTNNYTNKSADQIKLILNGKRYDWNSGMPTEIQEEFYIYGGETKSITGGLQFINSRTINQAEITGTDILINLEIKPNSLSCTVVEEPPMLMYGPDLNVKMKQLADPTNASSISDVNYVDENITAFQRYTGTPSASNLTIEHEVQDANSNGKIYMWYDNGIIYYWSELEIVQLNTDAESMFNRMSNLANISGLAYVDTAKTESMKQLFTRCFDLSDFSPIKNWDTSNVTNFYGTFTNCSSLSNLIYFKNWNTSSATTMYFMFGTGYSVEIQYTNVDALSDWNTSNVEDMSSMFQRSTSLVSLEGLQSWDTSKVKYMSFIFAGATSLTNLAGLENWDVSKVEDFSSGFATDTSLSDISALANWNVASLENMNQMFGGNTGDVMSISSLEPLRNWNVGGVTNMYQLFRLQQSIANLDALEDWDVKNVENMEYTFVSCISLTDVSGINDWDVRNVSSFTRMFGSVPNNLHPNFTLVNGTWSGGTFTKTSNN